MTVQGNIYFWALQDTFSKIIATPNAAVVSESPKNHYFSEISLFCALFFKIKQKNDKSLFMFKNTLKFHRKTIKTIFFHHNLAENLKINKFSSKNIEKTLKKQVLSKTIKFSL